MKYLSLFSGIGGFELGIQQAYETLRQLQSEVPRQQDSQDIKDKRGMLNGGQPNCIGYSEIDKYAIQIYERHFKHKNYGDITKLDPTTIPDFDLLVGGFPCQAFSIAGKRKGFDDTRGTLFFDIARILRAKQPRLFLLENVKGLLSHDNGKTFSTIISTLDELGYDLQWQVLNSKNFGVPQNRERVFIVGHLRGTSRPKVFPFTENNSEDIVLPTITTRVTADSNGTYVGKRSPRQIIGGSQGNRVYDPKGISTTIASQAGGLGAKTGLYAVGGLQAHQKPRKDGISPTLTQAAGMGGGQTPIVWSKKIKIRRLTPKECERLQGFPDGWTEYGIGKEHKGYTGINSHLNGFEVVEISDTQRYKCLGNAVTVNVIREIIKRLL